MSKEDLARFKSADAKLLALQRRKALLDEMAVSNQRVSFQTFAAMMICLSLVTCASLK